MTCIKHIIVRDWLENHFVLCIFLFDPIWQIYVFFDKHFIPSSILHMSSMCIHKLPTYMVVK